MSIPKLRRLPVIRDDLNSLNLSIPDELVHHPYQHQFDHEEYRLLKLGLIEDDVAYIEADLLYFFGRSQPYRFDYKFRLTENENGAVTTELWADPRLNHKYIYGGTTEHQLGRIIGSVRRREHPATLDVYRKRPEFMGESNTYPMIDVELTKPEFWKLIWGFIPSSMDDHWRSWFDFETQILHVYWYWTPYHLYQIRFEESDVGFRAVDVKIAASLEAMKFDPAHATGIIQFFIRLCHYRMEEV